jgi:hypothetical protein
MENAHRRAYAQASIGNYAFAEDERPGASADRQPGADEYVISTYGVLALDPLKMR